MGLIETHQFRQQLKQLGWQTNQIKIRINHKHIEEFLILIEQKEANSWLQAIPEYPTLLEQQLKLKKTPPQLETLQVCLSNINQQVDYLYSATWEQQPAEHWNNIISQAIYREINLIVTQYQDKLMNLENTSVNLNP